VNDPADVQAIKTLLVEFSKSATAGDIAAIVTNYFTEDVIRQAPNSPMEKGKDAVASGWKTYLDNYTSALQSVAEDVWVSGDLAGARGTYTSKLTPKTSGAAIIDDQGKWTALYRRQPDGSWRCFADTWNSDRPIAQVLSSLGADEQALLQIERDWAEALVMKDVAALDKILATEFQANYVGVVGNKKQFLAAVKSDTTKFESMTNSEMKALVLGDTAIVHGLSTAKGSMGGKDTSGQERYTEVFVKRDGHWQCVTGYSTKVQ
jgi:ketosteroid isomerase-like protein